MMLNFKTSASVDAIPAADWRYQQKSICHSTKLCIIANSAAIFTASQGQRCRVLSRVQQRHIYKYPDRPTKPKDEPTNWEIHTLTESSIHEARRNRTRWCRWSTLLVTLLYLMTLLEHITSAIEPTRNQAPQLNFVSDWIQR